MKPEYEQRDDEWQGRAQTRTFRVRSTMIGKLEEIALFEGGDANDLIREGIMRVIDDRKQDEGGGEGAPVPSPDLPPHNEGEAEADPPMPIGQL